MKPKKSFTYSFIKLHRNHDSVPQRYLHCPGGGCRVGELLCLEEGTGAGGAHHSHTPAYVTSCQHRGGMEAVLRRGHCEAEVGVV